MPLRSLSNLLAAAAAANNERGSPDAPAERAGSPAAAGAQRAGSQEASTEQPSLLSQPYASAQCRK